jgi:hypothetical protein
MEKASLRAQMLASMLAAGTKGLRPVKKYYREPKPKTEAKAMARRRRQIENGQLRAANGLEVNCD